MTKIQIPVFTVLFFISATLIFSVQPMLGKMMLPFVGGSPAGWIVAMAFFQAALLAGYALAHICSKLNVFTQGLVTILFLLLGLSFVPVHFDGTGLTDLSAITPGVVFMKLALVVSIPFIALSSITPAFQRLFSAGQHETAKDPYYFYAASNLGSFFGLLSYPFIIEPFFSLSAQAQLWMWLYFGLIALSVIACVLIFKNNPDIIKLGFKLKEEERDSGETRTLKISDYIRWICLAAIPSSLILGVTTFITTNLTSIPLIWIIPLGLYLLSHVMAFSKRDYLSDSTTTNLIHVLLITLSIILYLSPSLYAGSVVEFLLLSLFFLATFFFTATLLHTKLANDRPPVKHLTAFYFMLSLGGALGGSFNAFVAPLIFDSTIEFPLVLAASLFFNSLLKKKQENTKVFALIGAVSVAAYFLANHVSLTQEGAMTGLSLSLAKLLWFVFSVGLFVSLINIRVVLAVSIISLSLHMFYFTPLEFEHIHRNFFGISKVNTNNYAINVSDDITVQTKVYSHGDTIHGLQVTESPYQTTPFSYYPVFSPTGYTFHIADAKNVGVVGLGAGVMACYQNYFPDISMSFFEIDAHVVEVAKEQFSYLNKCGYEKIWVGDGRLLLEAQQIEKTYDLLMIDAFTSDAIPLHILTKDALEGYFNNMSDDGIIILNISNRYLNLVKPLSAIARSLNKSAFFFTFISDPENQLTLDSQWVVLTKSDKYDTLFTDMGWVNLSDKYLGFPVWTDKYSNIVMTFKLGGTEAVGVTYDEWRTRSKAIKEYMQKALNLDLAWETNKEEDDKDKTSDTLE